MPVAVCYYKLFILEKIKIAHFLYVKKKPLVIMIISLQFDFS